MYRTTFLKTLLLYWALLCPGTSSAQIIDLSKAVIFASQTPGHPVKETAVKVLQEEIARRTFITLPNEQAAPHR